MFSSITTCTTTRTLKVFFNKKHNLNISGSNMKGVASHSTLSVAQSHTGSAAYLGVVSYPLRSSNELDTFEHYDK